MIKIDLGNAPLIPIKIFTPSIPVEVVKIDAIPIESVNTIIEVTEQASDYDGAYEVIPKARSSSVLQTKGKILAKNVTVTQVPYYETSNQYGDTVYIAEDING